MKRRDFMQVTAGALSAFALRGAGALAAIPRSTMGIVQYSFSHGPGTTSALEFLDYCHSLGAGGIQFGIDAIMADGPENVRKKAEDLGMYVEAISGLPKKESPDDFEKAVAAAKQAGAVCLRTACLSGRRYEDFSSLDEWKRFVDEAHSRIELALPILERQKLAAGIENHKDWTADELQSLIRHYDSEYLGVCLDTGNNISLLDDPMHLVETLAPYAVTTHIKDMVVEEYEDGFLLSEVPLGEGFLDLPRIAATISKARPRAHFSLEMITRDPLKIPCLTEKYWITFSGRNGRHLAQTLRMVRENKPQKPLALVSNLTPAARHEIEEGNVKECLRYAREKLMLAGA